MRHQITLQEVFDYNKIKFAELKRILSRLEAASEAKPPQAVSASASCSAQSASDKRGNEADTSPHSAGLRVLAELRKYVDERAGIAEKSSKLWPEGTHTHDYELGMSTAFQEVLTRIDSNIPPDAPPAAAAQAQSETSETK